MTPAEGPAGASAPARSDPPQAPASAPDLLLSPAQDAPGDAELMARLGRGDESAMDLLVDRYQADLLRTAHAIVGQREAAQDAVQEAFLKLCRERHRLVGGAIGGWLATVVRNHCLDQRRARRPQALPEQVTVTAPEPPAEPVIAARDLWSAVGRLSALERAAVILRYRDGHSYQQIAQTLGKTVSHVGVILNQAMTRLRADPTLREARHG